MNDYRYTLNLVGWILCAFSTFFVMARMFTRLKIATATPGSDDWCMLGGWIFAVICTSMVSTGTKHGFGQHIGDIKDPEDQATAAMFVLISPTFSIVSAFFTKTSIILGFMRIVGRTVTWVHKLMAYLPLLLLLAGSCVSIGVMIFFCWPVERAWRPYVEGSCLPPTILDSVGKTVSAYNAVMDVFCAIVPIFLIRNLNIKRKEKRNLIILMGGSIFGTFATIMKIVAMSSISNVADITYAWSEITIWYLTENHVLIIAGSFPALRPFWRIVVTRYSSYIGSYKSDRSTEGPSQKNASGSHQLHTVGSQPKKQKKPGLYSFAIPDSSEESLDRKKNREGDTESVKAILSNHGDKQINHNTLVDGGSNVGDHYTNLRRGPSKGAGGTNSYGITVTREVEVS